MEAATVEPTATAKGNGTLGTHPDGIGDDDEAQVRDAQLIGAGEVGQLSFDVGGKKPSTSRLRLAGRSIEIPRSQLKKGSEVTIQCRIRVSGVHFDDKLDGATESVQECVRKQIARIVGDVTVIPDLAQGE